MWYKSENNKKLIRRFRRFNKMLEIIKGNKLSFLIEEALKEDIGKGDLTTELILPKDKEARAVILAKEEGIVAGLPVAGACFKALDSKIEFIEEIKEGDRTEKDKVVASLRGRAWPILEAERTALNFLGRLSGIATLTSKFVEAVKPYPVKISDTRKTTPLFRCLEKYAVACGGGYNHRFGLDDAILIKDNHIKAAGSIKKAVERIRSRMKETEIECETRNLEEVREALSCQVEIIMLDNMDAERMRQAVEIIREKDAQVRIEASGGVTLENIRGIAATGVDIISIGALTHSAKTLDFSLKLID